MYTGVDFKQIEPGEVDVFSFEFTHALGYGNTLVSATWSCAVDTTISGSAPDTTPAARINGPASCIQNGNRSFTSQTVSGMIDGNNYILQATVSTSDGRTLQQYSHVFCRAAL